MAEEEKRRKEELAELEKKQKELEKNATLKDVCQYTHPSAHRKGNGDIRYTNVQLLDSNGKETNLIMTGERCRLVLEYKAVKESMHTKFVMGITREDGTYCYGTSVNMNHEKPSDLKEDGTVVFSFQNNLLKGNYFLDLWIESAKGVQYDAAYSLMMFKVDTKPYNERGIFTMPHDWDVDGQKYKN